MHWSTPPFAMKSAAMVRGVFQRWSSKAVDNHFTLQRSMKSGAYSPCVLLLFDVNLATIWASIAVWRKV
jgi:hypothetical protein